jgi:hypothetical protein
MGLRLNCRSFNCNSDVSGAVGCRRTPLAGPRALATAAVARFFEAARRPADASTLAVTSISLSRRFHFFYLFRDFFETISISVG